MARTMLTVSIECDLINDFLADWERVGRELPRRHGAAFRALDRRMSAIQEGEAPVSDTEWHDLGEANFIITAPREMVEVVAEARRLGVI
jgi:hypothetical protein